MVTVLFPTLFWASVEKAGPKHSTSVPSSERVAVPVSVDVNEVALVPGPNPVPGLAVNSLFGPHRTLPATICDKGHSKVPPTFTLQMVTPFLLPRTVHLKVKRSPGQVGEAVINCPLTSPAYVDRNTVSTAKQNCYFRQEFCGYHVCACYSSFPCYFRKTQ